MDDARIETLNLYPVKSCAGIRATRMQAAATGMRLDGVGDRQWMVADPARRFITQRDCATLALVQVALDGGSVVLRAPGAEPFTFDALAGTATDAVVWGDTVRAWDAGEPAARWLGSVLGREARLLRFDTTSPRFCNPLYAGPSGAHTLFADAFPVLVVGRASLDDLNARLARDGSAQVPMNRFRPNLVVRGLDPYEEDHLDLLETDAVTLRLVKPCVRCTITTVDQRTAGADLEPLRTLATYRRDDRFAGVTFGVNAIVERSGALAEGEPLRITHRF